MPHYADDSSLPPSDPPVYSEDDSDGDYEDSGIENFESATGNNHESSDDIPLVVSVDMWCGLPYTNLQCCRT